MNETRNYYARAHARRSFALWLIALLSLPACAGEQSVGPPQVLNLPVPLATIAAEGVAVGEQVVLWSPSDYSQLAPFDLIVAGPSVFEGDQGCPRASYRVSAFSPSRTQEGPKTGSWQWYSAQPLAGGTRLRFIGLVDSCEGSYYGWAFEVITAPGK